MLRKKEQEPRCRTIQSQAERRDRGQTEESWLLFEGIDTFLYDLMRKSKIEMKSCDGRAILSPTKQVSPFTMADPLVLAVGGLACPPLR